MAEENKRNEVKATSQVTVRATVDVSKEMDLNKLNSIQYMSYQEALMTLKNIRQALSCIKTKSKLFNCVFSPPHIDIETGAHHYQITCNLTMTSETSTSDDDVYNFGKYTIDASIILTTDSTGSLIADSSTELVKLVHDIETLCRELTTTQKYWIEDYNG